MADYRWNFQADASSGSRANNIIITLNKTVNSFIASTARATGSSHTYRDALGRLHDETGKYAGQNDRAGKSLIGLMGNFNTINKAVQFLVDDIKLLGKVFTDLYGNIMQTYAPLQSVNNEIAVLSNTSDPSGESTKKLMQTIEDLGATTPKTTTEVSRMALGMLRAGKNAAQATVMLDDIVDASIALGMDTDKAFGVANSTLSKFGDNLGFVAKEGDEMKTVLAMMTAAANSANTDIHELSSALLKGRSGGLKAFKVSLLETLTAIDVMAEKGVTGSKAMTILSSNLTQLIKKKTDLKKMGIEIYDAAGNFKSLRDVIASFEQSLSGKTQQQQAKVFTTLFGTQADAMQNMVSMGAQGFDTYTQKILNSVGAMDELVEAGKKTLLVQKALLDSAKQAVTIQMGKLFDPLIQHVFGTQAGVVSSLSKSLQTWVEDVIQRFDTLKATGVDTVNAWMQAVRDADFQKMASGWLEQLRPLQEMLKGILSGAFATIPNLFKAAWDEVGPPIAAWFQTKFPVYIQAGAKGVGDWFSTTFADEIEPGIEKLVAFLSEILTKVFIESVEIGLENAVKAVPVLIKIVLGGAAAVGEGITAPTIQGIERDDTILSIHDTVDAFNALFEKKKEIEAQGVISEQDTRKLANINNEMARLFDVIASLDQKVGGVIDQSYLDILKKRALQGVAVTQGTTAPKSYELGQDYSRLRSQIDAMTPSYERGIAASLRREQERQQAIAARAAEAASNQSGIVKMGANFWSNLERDTGVKRSAPAEPTDYELEKKADRLQEQMDVTSQTKQWQEAQEQANTALDEAKLKIMDIGQAFKKWLLQPVDQFKQAWANMRKQWNETVQGLKAKSLDIGQKFGLVSEEEAKKQQIALAQESLGITDQFLQSAQTGQERMTGNEQKADQLAQLAELTGNKDYAKQAQTALEEAQRAAMEQKKIELEKIQLDRKAAEDSLPVLQDMLTKTETAGGKSAILERLQTNLMSLGKAKEAAGVTDTLMKEQMKAAEENAQNLKLTAERLGLLVELAKRQLAQSGDTGEVEPTPDPGLKAAPSY
jgi:TP901 family phage tail tape measure protein